MTTGYAAERHACDVRISPAPGCRRFLLCQHSSRAVRKGKMFLCCCHPPSKVWEASCTSADLRWHRSGSVASQVDYTELTKSFERTHGNDEQQTLLRMSVFPSDVIAFVVGAINGSVCWQEIREVLCSVEVHADVSVQRSIKLHWDAQCLWHKLPISYSV